MIFPQSIAVDTAASGLVGKEGDLFKFTVRHSIVLAIIVGLLTMTQEYAGRTPDWLKADWRQYIFEHIKE